MTKIETKLLKILKKFRDRTLSRGEYTTDFSWAWQDDTIKEIMELFGNEK